MKKAFLYLAAFAFVAAPAWAQTGTTQEPTSRDKDQSMTSKATKQVAAEVVSTDKSLKTITVKTGSGDAMGSSSGSKTLVAKVDDKAVTLLDTVKPGEKVTLTCLSDKGGECDTVTSIKKAGPTSPNDKE
jgi:hypothetical protein